MFVRCCHDLQDGSYIYCLALVKTGDVNIIGREYLTRRVNLRGHAINQFT